MLMQGTSRSACWQDLPAAALYSMIAMAAFTALLAAGRWYEVVPTGTDPGCSIISCVVSGDARRALVKYRTPGLSSQCLHIGLATVDLQGTDNRFQSAPTLSAPRALAQLKDQWSYIFGADGPSMVRHIDGRKTSAPDGFERPEGCPGNLSALADGRTVLKMSTGGQLQALEVEQNLVRWERDVECFALHPRCGLYAALSDRAIVQLSMETGGVLRTISRCQQSALALAVDPLGNAIALLDCQGGVEMRRLCDGKSLWRHKAHGAQALPAWHRANEFAPVLTFSADGHDMVTAAREGEWVLAIWNAKTGDRIQTLRGHDNPINGTAFLPDRSLISWGADGTLRLWDARRGVVKRIFSIRQRVAPSTNWWQGKENCKAAQPGSI